MARSIVVVEDDKDIRAALVALLEFEGHVVRAVADGPSGVKLILRDLPFVSFIDVGLPLLDGYGVAQQVRADARGAGLRLVALTGSSGQDTRARSAGFDAYVVKPVDATRLLELVGP